MKILSLVLLSVFSIGLLSGCKSDSVTPDAATIQQIFPMSVGNSWTYHLQEFNDFGVVKNDTTFSLSIIGKRSFAGNDGFLGLSSQENDSVILYYSGSDLYTVNSPNSLTPSSEKILHYPMNAGETYVLRDTVYADSSRSKEILVFRGSGESVTVPAGTFSCYHFDDIRFYGKPSEYDTTNMDKLYFSKNIGYVKNDNLGDFNGNMILRAGLELKSYIVKP